MTDTGKAQATLIAQRDAAEEGLKAAEANIRELEARLEEESREFTDMGVLRQRIADKMDDERKQYQKDLAERDFTADQTRKKYQGTVFSFMRPCLINMSLAYTAELAQLSEGQCSLYVHPGCQQTHVILDRTTKPKGVDQQTSRRIAQSPFKQRRPFFTL